MKYFKDKLQKPKIKSEITVLLAFILTLTFALILAVIESARTSAGRLYFTQTADSAIDSLFSQYHRELWDGYRLLGLEHYSEKQICDEMNNFMSTYMDAKTYFQAEIKGTTVTEKCLITEKNGHEFEREVLDYMKYGIIAKIWDISKISEYLKTVKSGEAIDRTALNYMDHGKEAVSIEQCLVDIKDCLSRAEERYRKACREALSEDCSGFVKEAGKIKTEMKKLPGLVEKYEKAADKLKKSLEESRAKFENEKKNLTVEEISLLNNEISEYENYVSEDGKRRSQIRDFKNRAADNIIFIEEEIAKARELQEYIDDYYDDEDHGHLNTALLWRQFERGFEAFDVINLPVQAGIEDKEKENALENVRALMEGNLLKLVLPKGADVSSEKLDLSDCPSKNCSYSGEDTASLEERTFFAEYDTDVFDYFGRGSYDKEKSAAGSGHEEIEYILFGGDNDLENLSSTVKDLISFRTGVNLSYLLKDTEKRNEAKSMAALIAGVTGFTPVVTVMTFLILSAWALGQAVCDVRDMLQGEKVPLIHNKNTFYLSLSGLIELGKNNSLEKRKSENSGFMYREYLKIFLFARYSTDFDYRAMDMIQMCIRSKQGDFRMDRMISSAQIGVCTQTKHVFTDIPLLRKLFQTPEKTYEMNVSTSFSY